MLAMRNPKRKLVVMATAVPEDVVRQAQVLIVTRDTWHLIGPGKLRAHGLSREIPAPSVTCPMVDVSGVKDEERMRGIMEACVSPVAGVFNMAGLTTGLEALGGKVVRVTGKAGVKRGRKARVQ